MSDEVYVRVNDQLAARGAGFKDPDRESNPLSMTKEPRKVKKTSFVMERIGSGELIEVQAPKKEPPKKEPPEKEPPKKEPPEK